MTARKTRYILAAAAVIVLAQTGPGQRASHWRVYQVSEGLPEPACSSVSTTPQGKILAVNRNATAVVELDGYQVEKLPGPRDSLGRICQSPSGQLWAIAPDGLREFKDGAWIHHPVPEIAAAIRPGVPNQRIPFCPTRQGHVIFLLPDRLMEFAADDPEHPQVTVIRAADRTRLGLFLDLTLARDGGLWVTGERGLAKVAGPARNLSPESEWREHLLPAALPARRLQEPQEDQAGTLTLIAESTSGAPRQALSFDGQHWTVLLPDAGNIQHAWRTPDGRRWAVTPQSLLEWDAGRGAMVESEEISARRFLDVAVEPGGAFWLATSGGLFRHAPSLWRLPEDLPPFNAAVQCLAVDARGSLWFVAGGFLHSLLDERHREYAMPGLPQPVPSARALFPLKNGTLLLDLGETRLRFQPADGSFATLPVGDGRRSFKPLSLLPDGSLCVQAESNPSRLELFDGTEFRPVPDLPPAPPETEFLAMFSARNGDRWISSDQGLFWFHERRWQTFVSSDRTAPEAARQFIELADGRIWCATEREVWEFDGRDWSLARGGFDRIYNLLQGGDGSVWVASNNGLSRLLHGAWIENGIEDGLASASIRGLSLDQRGRVWAATSQGLSLYHPEADPDPPRTLIQPLAGPRNRVPEGGAVDFRFSAVDKWKYAARARLLYSHRLDEREWSAFQDENSVSFRNLSPGKHFFQVRSMDRNGNVEPAPAMIEFTVALPWYKETRLVLISLAGVGAALFFAALAFNRHRQLLRSYAAVEKKIAERTKELEIANRGLLHSQKMNALGTLAAGIAHDFNNILSIIKGSAQIIEDNLDNPEKVRTRVDRIKTVVEQGSGIVKAMLGFSRDSEGQPARCEPNDVVADTIRLLGDRFLREVEVGFEPASDLPPVSASRDFIQQILLNFIFNAAEAMSRQKHIAVVTRRLRELPAGLVLSPAAAAEYVAVSVRDSGCGIPPEILPRIFEPFFTTKALSTRRGTGLGLSMAYELAKKMEAGLAVESMVDQGSTFTLILPAEGERA